MAELLMIVMILAGVMAAAFWVDYLFEQRLRTEARKRHPSHSNYCVDCAMQIEDVDVHRRLMHLARPRSLEDSDSW